MESKRFEDWEKVDCNECAKYWDSSCDGVKCNANSDKSSTGSTRLCNSFLPTRSVVIPARINELEKEVGRLTATSFFTSLTLVLYILFDLMGWV